MVHAGAKAADRVDEVPAGVGRQRSELRAGVIDHMAFSASGLRDAIAKLDANGVAYQCRQQVGSGVWQVFFHDPSGAKVELDFAPEEPAPR